MRKGKVIMRISLKQTKKAVIGTVAIWVFGLMVLFQANPPTALSSVDHIATLYAAKCASCHAKDGSGNTAAGKSLKLRDLRSAEVQAQSDDQLFNVTAKGKGKMPKYEKSLGADKCKQLVTYIRHLGGK